MKTVMLVEDNPEIGRLLKMLLELEGCRVVIATTCEEVLPLLHERLPDAILMDVNLKGRETIDLVCHMRGSDEKVARIPVLMTSATDRRRECLEAGADRFIMKPYLPDEVVQEVMLVLRQQSGCAGKLPPGSISGHRA